MTIFEATVLLLCLFIVSGALLLYVIHRGFRRIYQTSTAHLVSPILAYSAEKCERDTDLGVGIKNVTLGSLDS